MKSKVNCHRKSHLSPKKSPKNTETQNLMTGKINIHFKRCLVVLPYSYSGWERFIYKYISETFGLHGLHCDLYQIKEGKPDPEEFINIIHSKNKIYDFIFTFNRFPSNSIKIVNVPVDIYSFANVPIVTWLIDNIGHHIEFLQRQKIEGTEVLLVADANGISTGARYGLPLDKNSFFPMWGPRRTEPSIPISERDIQVLFTGDIIAEEPLSVMRERVAGVDLVLLRIIDQTIARMIDDRGSQDPYAVMVEEALKCGRESAALQLFPPIDRWLRQRRRRDLLRRFTSVPVTICGEVQDEIISSRANVKVLGRTQVEQVEALAKRARILLGDFAHFVDGVEARPALAMSNGCIFACEENRYFKQQFPSDAYISLYPDKMDPQQTVADALADSERLNDIDRTAAITFDRMLMAPLSFIQGQPLR